MKITRTAADTLNIEITQQEIETLAYVVEEHGDTPHQAFCAEGPEHLLCAAFMRQAIEHLAVQY